MNVSNWIKQFVLLTAVALILIFNSVAGYSQSLGSLDKDRGKAMLKNLKDDIKKRYYDPNYHGIDIDTRFKQADEKINQATSNGQIMGIIAQTLIDFNDSHLFFLPPSRSTKTEYGWQMTMIGDKCFITEVKKESDAEKKGLKAGDQILSINGFTPDRPNLWKMQYSYNVLRPQPALKLEVMSPDGKQKQVDVLAKVTQGKQILDLTDYDEVLNMTRESEKNGDPDRHRFVRVGDDMMIWKMPAFDLFEDDVDKAMSKVKNANTLVIDLRGNGGGLVLMLQRLVGHLFDHDVTIGVEKGRKDSEPLIAKTRGDKCFKGNLVVLIDSRSGSCSEIFARTIQLEKRGTVLGDTSAGAVMISRRYSHKLGTKSVIFYGVSVTEFDIIMPDGKSLEHVGVTPDEKVLPTGADMANNHDPVLAKAATIAGEKIDAEQAGKLYSAESKK